MPLSDAEINALYQGGAKPEEVAAYEAQLDAKNQKAAAPAAPAQDAQAAPSSPGFFAPGQPTQRMGQGMIDAFPFARAAVNVASGNPAYSESGADLAGRVAGDIGGAAAAVPYGVEKLAQFAAAAGGMNAAGIPQAVKGAEQKLDAVAPKPSLPSKVAGVEGLGTALNFLGLAPQGAAETAMEVAPYALLGHATEPEPKAAPEPAKAPVLSPEQVKAQALQQAGYPVTASHLTPGDTALKAATTNPDAAVVPQAAIYKQKLQEAAAADLAGALDTGKDNTTTLGQKFTKSFADAMNQRSGDYSKMMDYVSSTNPAGENTGIGQFTHAGKAFQQQLYADLASKGLDLRSLEEGSPRYKALQGGGLTQYDVPTGMNPADATAAIKFADLVSQKAKSATDLDTEASTFAKTNKVFSENGGAGADKNAFLKQVRGATQDQIAEILKARDKQMGTAGTPQSSYDAWAQQKDKYAKYYDLADEYAQDFATKKTRQGGQEMYSANRQSPEQVFGKTFANGSADTIKAFKGFLQDHGQDPGVIEQMGKDWLGDIAKTAQEKNGGDPVQAVKSAWAKMPQERRDAIFSPATAKGITDAIGRAEAARAPLEVMGTKASGESQTQARSALATAAKPLTKAGIGAAAGLMHGGPVGAVVGGGLGAAAEALSQGMARARALKALQPMPPIEAPAAPAPTMMQRFAAAARQPIAGTPAPPVALPALIRQLVGAKSY